MGERVPRAVIESVRPEFFVEFLEPFGAYCASRGLARDLASASRDPEAFSDAVYALFNTTDARMPKGLRAAIDAVVHVADDDGRDHVHAALARLDAPPEIPSRLTQAELALWAYERYADAFADAVRRKQKTAKQRFREFLPKERRSLASALGAETRARLLARLRERHGTLGHTRYADVRVAADDDEVRVFWIHGLGARAQGVIRSDAEREVQRVVHDRCDLTFVDRATGRLSVSALNPDQVGFLRETLGSVLFGDAGHYANAEIYSGAPLLERGRRALSVDGIAGLRRVALRAVTLYYPSRGRSTHESDGCLFDTHPDEMLAARRAPDACVLRMKLAIGYAVDSYERTIEVATPNYLKFDRRIAEPSLREFLVTRGFADYGEPAAGATKLAAA